MKTIGVVTVARSDYGIWQPVLKRIAAEPTLDLWMYVGGMHLESKYGASIKLVEQDDYRIKARIPMHMRSNDGAGVARSMGAGVAGFGAAFASERPDILCVLGDRFDMIPAVLAAAPCQLPVAHVHGGETTEGAMDELFRHAITKMSHLHFASTREYADRILQMGEEPWRVAVSGAPALDHLRETPLLAREELARRCGVRLDEDPLLVTYHPATLEALSAAEQIEGLLTALAPLTAPIVFTLPNADMGGDEMAAMIRRFLQHHQNAVLVDNMGAQAYFSMMSIAAAMVGNSSSGIIEAASFGLPVVNIGSRQKGRIRNANVIDCGYSPDAIRVALERALQPAFRLSLNNLSNRYGDGRAADRIVARLLQADDRKALLYKRFHALA